jgi:leucyl/phenylalanyl-tRNA---protein transferase
MAQADFLDPNLYSTPEGIVALGGSLNPERLIQAYRMGIFPWPMAGIPLPWFCPPERAILEYSYLHIPRSLGKLRTRSLYRFTLDQSFEEVITHCAAMPRPGQDGTWITRGMKKAYLELHGLGVAHSVEAWQGSELVGGLYGVDAGGAFAAESMFYRAPNASKLALLYLIEHLHSIGLDWIDIQVMTPHLEALGAREVTRNEFLERLRATQRLGLVLFPA